MTDTLFPDEVTTSLGDDLAAIGAAFRSLLKFRFRWPRRSRRQAERTGPRHAKAGVTV